MTLATTRHTRRHDVGQHLKNLIAALDQTLTKTAHRRLTALESLRTRTLTDITRLTTETTHAHDDLQKPLPQSAQLTTARDRVRHIEHQLKQAAAPSPPTSKHHDPDMAKRHSATHTTPTASPPQPCTTPE